MQITGYKIRRALQTWQLRRDTASGQFDGTLFTFEGDEKPHPDEVSKALQEAETAIARLQVAQTRYNTMNVVKVDGLGSITMLECIKRLGGLGRIEKMWRGASKVKSEGYGYGDRTTRDKDQETARRVVSFNEASKRTAALGNTLGSLRESIAVGNAAVIEVENLDAALFE